MQVLWAEGLGHVLGFWQGLAGILQGLQLFFCRKGAGGLRICDFGSEVRGFDVYISWPAAGSIHGFEYCIQSSAGGCICCSQGC